MSLVDMKIFEQFKFYPLDGGKIQIQKAVFLLSRSLAFLVFKGTICRVTFFSPLFQSFKERQFVRSLFGN